MSLARSAVLMAATRLPHERRLAPAGRALLRPLKRGRAEVATGLARGIAFDVRHLPLEIPVQGALRRHLGPGGVLFDVGGKIHVLAAPR